MFVLLSMARQKQTLTNAERKKKEKEEAAGKRKAAKKIYGATASRTSRTDRTNRTKQAGQAGQSGVASKHVPLTGGSSHRGQKLNVWDADDMKKALKMYYDSRAPGFPGKRITSRDIQRIFGIPKSTFANRVVSDESKHKVKSDGHASGGKDNPKVFTKEEEDELHHVIAFHARAGLGFTPSDVRQMAYEYCIANGKDVALKALEEEELSWRWYYGFLRRYDDIKPRTPQDMALHRAKAMKPEIIDEWFKMYEKVVDDLGITSPLQVWNIDETGCIDQPKRRKFLGVKGEKMNNLVSGERGELTTVLSYMSASGISTPPMVIHKGGKLGRTYDKWKTGMMNDVQLRSSETGWISKELFTDYGRYFIKFLEERNLLGMPHIVVMDGHTAHTYNYEFLSLMAFNNITIVTFPSHTTALIQPFDTIPAFVFKYGFNGNLVKHNRKVVTRRLAKSEFFLVFNPAWRRAVKVCNLEKAFRITGIWPVNRAAIPEYKFNINRYVEECKLPCFLAVLHICSCSSPLLLQLSYIYIVFNFL